MRYVFREDIVRVCGGVILMANEVWKPVKGYEGLYEEIRKEVIIS